MTIEKQACTHLAFMWLRQNKPRHPAPWQWAKRHWMEFLTELDTDNGKMWLELARRDREQQP